MSLYAKLEITNALSTYCGAKLHLFLHPNLNKTCENLYKIKKFKKKSGKCSIRKFRYIWIVSHSGNAY